MRQSGSSRALVSAFTMPRYELLGGDNEAARVHNVCRWCGGVAVRGARPVGEERTQGWVFCGLTPLPQLRHAFSRFAKDCVRRNLLKAKIS